ncbi:uncharacterized protein PAC_17279 [Phialocephala subalpina]|uniref:SET domain-containing protein n=1 Tax=Phialocephala subalpina TaxID=576137 RepID=A0A1L7XQR5_9HELO|nr:uncharacterized protein PAC_17279 [Phialocephala subalpina]
MGFDCGFDIYPPLERTKANQERYELFLREVLVAYGPRDGEDADRGGGGDGGSVVRVNAESEESYIDFEVGEHPHIPRRCEHFLRFSSKVSGRSLAEPYIRGVYKIAKQWLGDRVYFWHEMNEFGAYIRQYGCYNWNEIHVARRRIREHKQQAEEREREDIQREESQDELNQGGDGTDRIADVSASRDKLYTIKPISGKGRGFIATSKIPKGTRILLEVALFKTPGSTEDIASAEIIALREVKSLTRDQQRAFLALQNVQGRKCTPILGTVMTNMLPLGDSNSGGLFLEASRINHSCQPNAQHTWNGDLGHLTVHALRDIEANREITISYISGLSPGYAERQHHLMNSFSFACSCELCSLLPLARASSDYRLGQIRSINEDEGAATDLDRVLEHPAESFRQVHRLFRLLEEEGICDIRLVRACFNAFQIAVVVGDKARAQVFAERAYAARKVLSGGDHPMTIAFKHLAKQPVDYDLYGKRMKCYDDSWEAPWGTCGEELENWLWNTDGWSRYSFS